MTPAVYLRPQDKSNGIDKYEVSGRDRAENTLLSQNLPNLAEQGILHERLLQESQASIQ
jgi:hypothetical protein